LHRYDPYAGDADKEKAASSGQAQADGQNAYENMKDLFALARQQGRLAADDTRGGWKGQGQLKGGWAGGKDLGEVAPDPKGGAEDEMPSSTSSWSDSAEVAQFRPRIATKKRSADEFAPSGAAVADGRGSPRDDGGRSSKKRRREKHHTKKEKKSSKSAGCPFAPTLAHVRGGARRSPNACQACSHPWVSVSSLRYRPYMVVAPAKPHPPA